MNINKLFDKTLDITTKNDKKFHIENRRLYIHDFSFNQDKANIIIEGNNIYVIREVYSYDNDRIRYLYDVYEDIKSYETYEKSDDGSKEIPTYVVESYKRKSTCIGSIGNIVKIDSDKALRPNNRVVDNPLILKLLRRNKKNGIQNLIKAK